MPLATDSLSIHSTREQRSAAISQCISQYANENPEAPPEQAQAA